MSEHGYAPGHRVSEFAGGFPPIANVLGVRVNSGASSLSALRGLEGCWVCTCAPRHEGSSAVHSGAFPPPPPIPGAVCKGDRGRPFSFCFPQCSCQLKGRETSRREAGWGTERGFGGFSHEKRWQSHWAVFPLLAFLCLMLNSYPGTCFLSFCSAGFTAEVPSVGHGERGR